MYNPLEIILKRVYSVLLGFFRAPVKRKYDGTHHRKLLPNSELHAIRVPKSHLSPACHPLEPQMTNEVDAYFIQNWPFKNEEQINKFRNAGFSKVTCCYYPQALDDRIGFACRLLTLLFLIDDLLEHMSFEKGKAYNERLMPISRGDELPDRSVPVEWITYDLWASMRRCDRKLADEILEPVFLFMRAQTDPTRKKHMDLGAYLEYRERDVGKALLSALMRFVVKLELTPSELDIVRDCDLNCAKHISVVNDIYSWEKELRQSQESDQEGSVLCSSVQVIMEVAKTNAASAKRILWSMCREWEVRHLKLVQEIQDKVGSDVILTYCKGLEYQMSGNEMWSRETKRYNQH